MEVAKALST
jgi:hypothetical protein